MWAQGEQAGHVWGEVQTIQGCQVSHQGWQVPTKDEIRAVFAVLPIFLFSIFINNSGIFIVIYLYCDWCWEHLYCSFLSCRYTCESLWMRLLLIILRNRN